MKKEMRESEDWMGWPFANDMEKPRKKQKKHNVSSYLSILMSIGQKTLVHPFLYNNKINLCALFTV